MKRIRTGYLAVSFACLLLLSACRPGLSRGEFQVTGPFDTVSFIILVTEGGEDYDRFRDLIEEELWRYHALYDRFKDYPGLVNLKTVNDRAGTAVTCPPELIDLVEYGLEAYERTGGRVNMALGGPLALWHEARETANRSPEEAYLPSDQALREAGAHSSIDQVLLDRRKGTIELADPALSLDLGALAKGFAVERIGCLLEEEGLASGLLDIGGNVRAVGRNDLTGQAWRVGIRDPDPQAPGLLDTLEIDGLSVVSSGSYERYFIYEGQRYSHILDPDTLYPASFHEAVTVIAPDSATGDLLSTALMLLDLEEGKALLADFPGCSALWVTGGEIAFSEGYGEYRAPARP